MKSKFLDDCANSLRAGSKLEINNDILRDFTSCIAKIIEGCYREFAANSCENSYAKKKLVSETERLLAVLMQIGYTDNINHFLYAAEKMYIAVFQNLDYFWDNEEGGTTMFDEDCVDGALDILEQLNKDLGIE